MKFSPLYNSFISRHFALLFVLILLLLSCKQSDSPYVETNKATTLVKEVPVFYAKGFRILDFGGYTKIEVRKPWPGAKAIQEYYLVSKDTTVPESLQNKQVIRTPVDRIIVTSTTDIPIMEALAIEKQLVGFPNTKYVSSEKTRTLIDKGHVREIGKEAALNTEVVLDVAPDLIIGFSATGDTKSYDVLQNSGVPVVYNGSWMEQHPLGRAEWIKFIASFVRRGTVAHKEFRKIESAYVAAAQSVLHVTKKPTILSGSLYRDTWYVPGGNSFIAKIYKDAQTDYYWDTNNETGSLGLSFESVLDTAQHADLWITGADVSDINKLLANHEAYQLFEATANKKVYTHSLKKGATGGMLYYEIGSLRPDLILKDVIKIAHPEKLPAYKLFFLDQLQ